MRDVVKVADRNRIQSQRKGQNLKKRRKKRKSNRVLYYIMFLMIAGTIVVVLSLTVFFNISTIEFGGHSVYTSQQISQVIGVKKGDNLFKLDENKVRNSILTKLPEVETVEIKRKLPDKLVINVTPVKPTAIVENDNKFFEVSSKGKIIKQIDSEDKNLFIIKGIDPQTIVAGKKLKSKDKVKDSIYKTMVDAFTELKFEKVTAIDLSDKQNIQFTYNGTIPVELGGQYDLHYKIGFVKQVIETQMPENFDGRIVMAGNNFAQLVDKSDKKEETKNDNIVIS